MQIKGIQRQTKEGSRSRLNVSIVARVPQIDRNDKWLNKVQ